MHLKYNCLLAACVLLFGRPCPGDLNGSGATQLLDSFLVHFYSMISMKISLIESVRQLSSSFVEIQCDPVSFFPCKRWISWGILMGAHGFGYYQNFFIWRMFRHRSKMVQWPLKGISIKCVCSKWHVFFLDRYLLYPILSQGSWHSVHWGGGGGYWLVYTLYVF